MDTSILGWFTLSSQEHHLKKRRDTGRFSGFELFFYDPHETSSPVSSLFYMWNIGPPGNSPPCLVDGLFAFQQGQFFIPWLEMVPHDHSDESIINPPILR